MKKIFLLLMLSVFIFACGKKEDSIYLTMGTNATFPPFEYIGGSSGNEVMGFDIELAKIIAEKLGKTLKIEDIDFDALIPALQSGKIDMILSGMTITEERRANVAFSNPYYEASQVVLIRTDDTTFGDIKTKEDLGANKVLAAQFGTTGSIVANEIATKDIVAELKSCELVVMELLNGKIDAVIIDKEPAKAFVSRHDNLSVLPINFDAEHYGIAVKKDNTELVNEINKILNELLVSGEYNRLVENHINAYSGEE